MAGSSPTGGAPKPTLTATAACATAAAGVGLRRYGRGIRGGGLARLLAAAAAASPPPGLPPSRPVVTGGLGLTASPLHNRGTSVLPTSAHSGSSYGDSSASFTRAFAATVSSAAGGGGGSSSGGGGGSAGQGAAAPRPAAPPASHYEVLGVGPGASLADVKAAFRARAKELHPDALAARGRAQTQAQARARPRQAQPHRPPAAGDPDGAGSIGVGPGAGAGDGMGGTSGAVEASASAFLRLVAAYECLSSPQARRQYDQELASARAAGGAGARPGAGGDTAASAAAGAAAAGPSGRGVATVDFRAWRYGVGDWMLRPRREPVSGRAAALEYYLRKYRDEFEGSLHAALVHAYLGPRLDLQPGELPRCFEGELRRTPSLRGGAAPAPGLAPGALSGALMHLVSGRTLLGAVWAREPLALGPGDSADAVGPGAAPAAIGGSPTDPSPSSPHAPTPASAPSAPSAPFAPSAPGTPDAAYAHPPTGASPSGLQPAASRHATAGAKTASTALPTAPTPPHSPPLDSTPPASPASPGVPWGTGAPPEVPADVGPSAPHLAADAGVDPLSLLPPKRLRGLSDDQVTALAAASLAAEDAAMRGGGAGAALAQAVPGYSRLRGLLEMHGFYPDPAAMQRRSLQISLVTAAEAAEARNPAAAPLGGGRLRDRWAHGGGGGGSRAPAALTGAAESLAEAGQRRREEEEGTAAAAPELPEGVVPPPQLQELLEAARVAEAEDAAERAAVRAAAARAAAQRPLPPPPPPNDPRRWDFGIAGADGDSPAAGPDGVAPGAAAAAAAAADGVPHGQTYGSGGVVTLELRLGPDLSAVAVYQPPPPPPPAAKPGDPGWTLPPWPGPAGAPDQGSSASGTAGGGGKAGGGGNAGGGDGGGGGGAAGQGADALTVEPLFGRVVEGRVKVYVRGRLAAGVEGRHVVDPEGHRVALLVRGSWPGLATLHAFDATNPRRLRLLCRCVKARLLPSGTWLFPPRERTHDIGGWYFEWGGYGNRGRPGVGWLDPSVYVFVAALVAAEAERVRAQRRAALSDVLGAWGRAVRSVLGGWGGGGGGGARA